MGIQVTSDPEYLLDERIHHFTQRAKSRREAESGLVELEEKIRGLAVESPHMEDAWTTT